MADERESEGASGHGHIPFVRNLKKLRAAAGMSQGALARASGLSERTIARLEAGHNFPKVRTLRLLASILGVSSAQLQGQPDHPLPLPTTEELAAAGLGPIIPTMKVPVFKVSAGLPEKPRQRPAFWRCPECGNSYNWDVPICPNDRQPQPPGG